jgi:septum formation protein
MNARDPITPRSGAGTETVEDGPQRQPALVLASASPRRRDLLRNLGIAFDVVPSRAPEVRRPGEDAAQFARRIARDKAEEVAARCPQQYVLGGDTIVVVDDSVFGKPADRDEARRMLRILSGRTHRVLTAVALLDPDGRVEETLVETRVDFRPLSEEEIESYLDSGEPFDKAGAYAVQGLAKGFVAGVHGSFTNVVGLPMKEVADLLQRRLRFDTNAKGSAG